MTASTSAAGADVAAGPIPTRYAQPSPFAGFGHQFRFMVRLDRVRALIWVVALSGLVILSGASVIGLYQTPAELRSYAAIATADPALKAITGPGYGLDHPTEGAVVMNETFMYALIAVALMSLFMLVRHTRAEEETDRAELVRAAPVGRLATLAAAMCWVAVLDVAVGVALGAGMVALGLPTVGSMAFGAVAIGFGFLVTGLAAVAAQIAVTGRSARGVGGVALGVFFVLRAVGDIGGGALSWASPLGWALAIRPYANERWWVLAPLGLGTLLLSAGAIVLSNRRDLGAGTLPQRPGPPVAGPRLAGPLGLAVRLQRSTVISWALGLGVTGFFFGLVADQAGDLAENEAVAKIFDQAGQGSVTDSFLATLVLLMAIIGSGFTTAAVLRMRSEERAQRVEPILATPVSRVRWFASHLTVAGVGSIVLMVCAGFGIGLGDLVGTGNAAQILPLLGAAVTMVPAMWVLGAVTATLIGLRPGWAPLAWAGVAVAAVVGLLAETLKLPQWARDLSPFQHVPLLPAASFSALPLAILLAVTVALLAVGAAAIGRRDIA